ncbi:MAG: NAD(P)/FAD-dependent oxidoreductase [Candidatus Eremiobacteraeota bacterium]|nr:NAD(P)/FAD-dependent oxidoreductase [Candidatus Eremiobacteraeota bacterium]
MVTYDAIIVGAGPAGLSAALVLGRSCRNVLVFDDGRQRNTVTPEMHGLLSRDGMAPTEFLRLGREELRRYPSVTLLKARVTHAVREGSEFSVRGGENGSHRARRLLLATGIDDVLPDIPGLREQWGVRVFVCPYCDAWELRGKRLAVIGRGQRAVGLAQELMRWSQALVVCTQSADDLTEDQRAWLRYARLPVQTAPINSLCRSADDALWLRFEDDTTIECDAAFACTLARQRSALVGMLGCEIDAGGAICIGGSGETSVPGCYAAGDAVTQIHQVVCAAASGLAAAIGINEALTEEETTALLKRRENVPGEL